MKKDASSAKIADIPNAVDNIRKDALNKKAARYWAAFLLLKLWLL